MSFKFKKIYILPIFIIIITIFFWYKGYLNTGSNTVFDHIKKLEQKNHYNLKLLK